MSHLVGYINESIIDVTTTPPSNNEAIEPASSADPLVEVPATPSSNNETIEPASSADPAPTDPPTELPGAPMLIRIMAPDCVHCTALNDRWARVEAAFRNMIPNLRTQEIVAHRVEGKHTIGTTHPQGLHSYLNWFPMLLLINGTLWDQAVAAHAVGGNLPLRDGVLVWGGQWINNVLKFRGMQHPEIWVQSLDSEQLGALTGPVRPIPVTPIPVTPLHAAPTGGPLNQLVEHQSLVQATYDVMGQIRNLQRGPLRQFLAQAVILEATDLIEPSQMGPAPTRSNSWCSLL